MINAFQLDYADRFLLNLGGQKAGFRSQNSEFLASNLLASDSSTLDSSRAKGDRELLYVLVIASEAGALETLYELQRRGFANVTDWSRNLPRPGEFPQPRSGEVMRILQRYRLRG
ncbi:MAG: hypothetical protein KME15_22865 [Drouetiella hepatica Uher 2000/2452]|jgi:hypothetical protein|uniref:Uncharacterized protein n=1 Tax=Drouetiella hepatica Uher 2000/2452 TaxID=904376 RepID=A0A951UPI8_9CYAN|nr:hypothetical protein [Drouetiella hepatica Uher 2000/2452]